MENENIGKGRHDRSGCEGERWREVGGSDDDGSRSKLGFKGHHCAGVGLSVMGTCSGGVLRRRKLRITQRNALRSLFFTGDLFFVQDGSHTHSLAQPNESAVTPQSSDLQCPKFPYVALMLLAVHVISCKTKESRWRRPGGAVPQTLSLMSHTCDVIDM